MNLNEEDLRHCHKVLASDTEECRIIAEGAHGGRAARLQKRMEDDRRVMARIETILGYAPEYEIVSEPE